MNSFLKLGVCGIAMRSHYGNETYYLSDEVDAALAAKDAEIAALKADAARLDKLPACFHMLRTLPGDGLAGWWFSYAPNNVYSDIRDAIDAHQEPKP